MKRVAAPVALFVILVLFNWKLLLTNQFTWLEGYDIAFQVLPWFQFQAGEWHHGRIPLWDPSSWMGQPLVGTAQPGAAFPLNWLLFLAPLKHGWMRQDVLHWYYVLARYLAALAAYALCRETGRSRAASVFGGCLYALGGYVGNTDWPQMVNGAICSPLVFLYLLRATQGRRPFASAVLSGFFLGFGWLAGHHQVNVFVGLAAAGLWAWAVVERKRGIDGKLLGLAAVSMIVAVFASAAQTLPTAEYGRQAVRWVDLPDPVRFNETVPYTVHADHALRPLALLGTFIPHIESATVPFFGIIGCALGLLGAALGWREKRFRWLAVISLLGLLFALGPNSLLHGLLYSVAPLVEKSRVAGAALVVFAVGLAPLAALALDSLPGMENFDWSRRAGTALWIIAATLPVVGLVLFAARVDGAVHSELMVTAIAAATLAAVLAAWRSNALSVPAGNAILIGAALFELATVTNSGLPNRAVPEQNPRLHLLGENSDVFDYIRVTGVQARIDVDDNVIPYAAGDWWGAETSLAPGAGVTERIWQSDIFSPRGQDFFGVRFYLGTKPSRPDLHLVFTGAKGVQVYENPGAYPRVWSVHRAVTAKPSGIQPLFRDATFDRREIAIVANPIEPPLAACPEKDRVWMPLHQPNHVRIQARLGCRGLVILTDTFFDGWRATVDGRAANIVEVDGAVRGVVVDAGDHAIDMRYRPWSVIAGAAMTLSAAIAAVWAWRSDTRPEGAAA